MKQYSLAALIFTIMLIAASKQPFSFTLLDPSELMTDQHALEAPRVVLQSSQRVFTEVSRALALVHSDKLKQFYVLGRGGSGLSRSVFIYDQHRNLVGQFSIGDARDIAVDHFGRIYVAGDRQVKVFDRSGRMIKAFPAPPTESLAVLSDGRIVVAYPTSEGLIHLYDPDGRRLSSFGRMKELDGYAPENRWLNRGKVVVGSGDEISYVFKNSPEPSVLKFLPTGELLLEFPIKGESIDLQTRSQRRFLASYDRSKVGGFLIIKSASVDLDSGHLWIAFNGSTDSGTVYEYNPQGVKLREYNLLIGADLALSSANDIRAARGAIHVLTRYGTVYVFDPATPPESFGGTQIALSVACPPAREMIDCTRTCPDGTVLDCKAAVLDSIDTTSEIIVDPVECKTDPDGKKGCKATATTCNKNTGAITTHETTIRLPCRR